jgi:hypothetical protein
MQSMPNLPGVVQARVIVVGDNRRQRALLLKTIKKIEIKKRLTAFRRRFE